MLHRCAALLAATLLVAGGSARAGMSPDPTGIWYDPAQPGWGMSVAQQGDVAFVALFVYDGAHQPAWYVASNLVDSGIHLDPIGSEVFSGALYRVSGPWFGAADFDPASVSVTRVGDLSLARFPSPVSPTLEVVYTVDGVSVGKTVQQQSWGNPSDLVGTFGGGIYLDAPSACQSQTPIAAQFSTLTLTQGSSPNALQMAWGTGLDTLCVMSGTYSQQGRVATLAGPVTCGPVANPTATVGTLTISDMTVDKHGFSGAAELRSDSCTRRGTAGGVKRTLSAPAAGPVSMTPDPTGFWYDPLHPGWGMSLNQQGGTTFAVLFVYDTNRAPRWFVASNVVDTGVITITRYPCAGGTCVSNEPVFAGPLYRTSGPSFAAPGDSTGLGVTPVGTLQLNYAVSGSLDVHYSVDGVVVDKHQIVPQTWSSNAARFAGHYSGAIFLTPSSASCPPFTSALVGTPIEIDVTGPRPSMQVRLANGSDACTTSGPYTPQGQNADYLGLGQSCTSPPLTGTPGSILELNVGVHGFTGAVSAAANGCTYAGNIGGVRR